MQHPRAKLLSILVLAVGAAPRWLPAQDLNPPDYSRAAVMNASSEVSAAWSRWRAAEKSLEQTVFRLPMSEAREQLQLALGRFLDFVESRKAYMQAVAAAVESRSGESRRSGPAITIETVYRD